MKGRFIAWTLVILASVSSLRAQNPAPHPSLCGPFPSLYKETVWNWLEQQLVDAKSAKIEWEGEPKPADLGSGENHVYGWLVNFKINSRNQFGLYTGKQSHAVLLRDNRVIKGIGFNY